MMYKVISTSRFRKDYKAIKKRGYDEKLLQYVVGLLERGEKLPDKYKDHPLAGDFLGCRECHIEPDWLLIYKIQNDVLILTLTRTGTHSDLF